MGLRQIDRDRPTIGIRTVGAERDLFAKRPTREQLLRRAKGPCRHRVEAFDEGQALFEVTELGVVSKRRDAPYRSGESRNWRKIKTAAWREANRERWRRFERDGATQKSRRSLCGREERLPR